MRGDGPAAPRVDVGIAAVVGWYIRRDCPKVGRPGRRPFQRLEAGFRHVGPKNGPRAGSGRLTPGRDRTRAHTVFAGAEGRLKTRRRM